MSDGLILVLVALLIGISKAGFGGGTAILVGPLLLILYPAKESVALMLPLLFACDVASLYPYWRKWDEFNVLTILPGAAVGIFLGSFALGSISDAFLAKTIGGLAIAFAVLQVYRDWIVRTEKPLAPSLGFGVVVGLGTGFVSTLSHVGGILTTMYLLPQRLENERFVGTTTALYFLINILKIPAYLQLEVLTLDVLLRDLPLFPIVFVGTALGVYLNRRVPGRWFMRVVLVFVLITGIHLLLK